MMENEQLIRAARAAINDAIARRDPEGIAAYFLPEYHAVTARSHQPHGKEAAKQSWEGLFARDVHSAHTSTPDEIHVNESWGMAAEQGRWTAKIMARQGPMEVDGVYSAKWHYTRDGWLLQAEIFTPTAVRYLDGQPLSRTG